MSKVNYATAHAIINALVEVEPGRERADNLKSWERAVRNRLRSEHWQMILAELETGASKEAIIATLTASPTQPSEPERPQPPAFSASDWEPASEGDKERARERLAEIRQTLRSAP